MRVKNRQGVYESVSFDKILKRIEALSYDLSDVDPSIITQETISNLYDGISTSELDNLSANTCVLKINQHPNYNILAGRIAVGNIIKETYEDFEKIIDLLKNVLSEDFYVFCKDNCNVLKTFFDYSRDYLFDYFAVKTLEKMYLTKINDKTIERPQHMWMRVAIQIHYKAKYESELEKFNKIKESYDYMSLLYFTHATPTLFNSGLKTNQISSCFLLGMDDSIEGIFKTLTDCAKISKTGGGIGMSLSNIRSSGSVIKGTNGKSDGIIPLCKLIESTSRFVNQSGKRKGSIACFVENTKVFTVNNGVKNIQDVQIGDLVITHENRIKKVQQTHKNLLKERKIYKLEVEKSNPIYVTGNHRFLSYHTKNKISYGWNSIEYLKDILDNTSESCYVITILKEILDNTRKYYEDGRLDECNNKLENEKKDNALKILSISETDRNDEYVYTLGVEDDHSYTVEGLVVENCFVEPWHADIFEFIELRKNTGDENLRARDLFIALWIPDLFYKRVANKEKWTLMCPNECKGLYDVYGEEFEELYTKYEKEGKGRRSVNAEDLMKHILVSQIETGMPYVSNKDHVNSRNMQSQLGTIRNSNLCVSGNTNILTNFGYRELKSIVDTELSIWNGNKWTKACIKKTGVNRQLNRIRFSNGDYIDCTDNHKFPIMGEREQIQCKDLQLGMQINFVLPNKKSYISNVNPKNNILMYQEGYLSGDYEYKSLSEPEKYKVKQSVPVPYCIDNKYNWFKGLCDSRCCVKSNDSFIFSSRNEFYIRGLRLLAQMLMYNGVISEIGGVYKLSLSCVNSILTESSEVLLSITDITPLDGLFDTYCFNEPTEHTGILNGVLSGNCNEISLISNDKTTSVCNLASISLPKFVENGKFNFEKLQHVAEIITRNLNNLIDVNYNPVDEGKDSNFQNRPLGIGVQGLVDVYAILKIPFSSEEARNLNKLIFENIYYSSVRKSIDLAKEFGPYSSIKNSPHSKGKLQFNLGMFEKNPPNLTLDWTDIFRDLKKYGIRNSVLTALMPTASTSSLFGNTESFEPMQSNVFIKKTLSGEFMIVNKYLVSELISLNLWNMKIKDEIIYDNGSIQNIKEIPNHIKQVYKTAFEISNKEIINQAADRQCFIDQQQSMNLFMKDVSVDKLNSALFYGWKCGLKSGLYYLRSVPAADAQKFGLDPESAERIKKERNKNKFCPRDPKLREMCDSCGS